MCFTCVVGQGDSLNLNIEIRLSGNWRKQKHMCEKILTFVLYMTRMRVKPNSLEGKSKCLVKARELFPLWCVVVSVVDSWVSLKYLGPAIVQK